MILVVMNHITAYCFDAPFNWRLNQDAFYSFAAILREFRMPLFFFISGFVLFKPKDVWNTSHIVSFFKKKIPIQLFSPFFFFAAYLYAKGISLYDGVVSPTKMGYWFTYTLLELFLFYAIARFSLDKTTLKGKRYDLIMIIYAIFILALSQFIPRTTLSDILGTRNWYYIIFLVIGTLVRKHFDYFERLLDQGIIVNISIIIFFFLNILYVDLPCKQFFYRILSIPGIIIVFAYFRKQYMDSSNFNNNVIKDIGIQSDFKLFWRTPLQFIGRRTLDIYLLHYFLIPTSLQDVISIFKVYPMPALELISSFLISIIVIAVCLIIGSILRLTPFMAHWVFGERYMSK